MYLLIFAVVTVYLTLRGIEEQQTMQFVMSGLRFTVMVVIIVTSLADIGTERNNQDGEHNDLVWPPLVSPRHIGHAIPILLFASTFQVQMPTISHAINNKSRNLPRVNLMAIVTCFIFYTALGIFVALAVDSVPSMASLAYRNYTGGHSRANRPAWTYIIEYLIVLTPALDVVSSFPLQALGISDAFITWRFGGDMNEIPWKSKLLLRFTVAFLPLLIAFFEFNLGTILDWVGLIGFFINQLSIPLFHMALRHMVAGESPYDINVHPAVSWITIFFNLALVFVVVGMNISEY